MRRAFRYLSVALRVRWRRLAQRINYGGRRPPICDDVATWAYRHQGAVAVPVLEPGRRRRNLPRTVEELILPVQSLIVDSQWPGRYLVPVKNARIIGRNGLVVLPDGSYSAEWWYNADKVRKESDYDAPPRRRVVRESGSYFPLLISHLAGRTNYYHWMHDTLLRYYGVAEFLPREVKFVVSADLAPFQRESLRCIGITDDQCVTFDEHAVWELETLYFARPTSKSGGSRPEPCLWLRDVILAAYGLESVGTRRLFVSRRRASARRLVNEDVVEGVLRKHGFETIVAEDLSFQEQVTTFAGASVIAATHGAGLTNMLFAAPCSTVIEVLPGSRTETPNYYWTMADVLGHAYWYFLGESVPSGGSEPDMRVPIEKLEATLEAALAETYDPRETRGQRSRWSH